MRDNFLIIQKRRFKNDPATILRRVRLLRVDNIQIFPLPIASEETIYAKNGKKRGAWRRRLQCILMHVTALLCAART